MSTAVAAGVAGTQRTLSFDTEQQVIDEVARLRRGYRQTGNWNLAQVCWHVGRPIEFFLSPPVPMGLAPTPEQAQKKAGFVDYIMTNRKAPPWVKDAPPPMVPPATAGESDIDQYVALLGRLRDYPHPKVMMGPIGPVTIAEFRACNLFHAAHHLAFLVPTAVSRREGLELADEDAIIADIRNLRERGYASAGSWSLAQVCWHLDAATKARMLPGPFPPNTPEQDARRPVKEQVLATGRLPAGLPAPEPFLPPAGCGDEAIDACVATLEKFKAFGGPISPHRLFGNLTLEEGRRINRAHCAHHLSYLVPGGK